MADAAKKVEAPKVAPVVEKEGAPSQPKAKRDLLSIMVVVLMTVNFLAVGGMGIFIKKIWSRIFDLQTQVETFRQEGEAAQHAQEEHDKEKAASMGHEMTPPVNGTLYPMESFLVNIASDQGPKFLQTQMELEMPDAALEDEITRKKAAIRDAVIVLLSSRTYKQLREANGMVKLRQDILRAVNNLLSTGKVREIYFTQFHFN